MRYDTTAHLTRPNLSIVANKSRAPANSDVKMAKIVQYFKSALELVIIICVVVSYEQGDAVTNNRVGRIPKIGG